MQGKESAAASLQLVPMKKLKTSSTSKNLYTSMPILFRFSNEFIIHFISHFLDLKCVSNLDVAITNRRLRRCYWLEYLACQSFLLPSIDTNIFTNISYNMWKWMTDRSINIRNLKIINNKLKEININAISMNNEDFLGIIRQCGDSLETIRVYAPDSITEVCYVNLCKTCPHLLNILLYTDTREHITDIVFKAIGYYCKKLIVLEIKCIRNKKSSLNITDLGILHLVRGCPLLDTITLQCCNKLTNQSIKHFLMFSPILFSLRLSECRLLNDDCLIYFMSENDGFQKLNYLILEGTGRMSDTKINHVIDYRSNINIEIWEHL